MATVRIVVNRLGVRAVARSPEVELELLRRAARVAARAREKAPPNQIIDVSPYLGRNRARVSIFAPFGLASDRETRWLGSSIDAARG
jgi:hypothetical protein